MVEDANKASGALGQAARESDTWGNQLGNLKQSLSDLKVTVGGAFLKPAIQVLKLFSQLVGHATDAVKSLTAEGRLLNRMFDRITNWLKKAQVYIERFVKKIGGAENAFKLLAIAAAAIITAMNPGAILSFLKNAMRLLNPLNLKVLAIAGVIAMLFLAVDDFINFMQGNNSVIGVIFEKWGIDADAVRQSVVEAWETIKTALTTAWNTLKKLGTAASDGLKAFWENNSEDILATLKSVWTAIKTMLATTWNVIETVAVAVFGGLKAFWDTWGSSIMGKFEGIFNFLLTTIRGLADFITGVFSGDWGKAWEGIKTVCGGAVTFISDLLGNLIPVITAVGTALALWNAGTIFNSVTSAATSFGNAITGLGKTITNAPALVSKFAAGIEALTIAKIKDKIETLQLIGMYTKDFFAAMGKAIWQMSKTAAMWVKNTASMAASKVAMLAMSVAQKAVTAAQWLLNAAMSANPIGLVIAAVVALIAIFIVLWKKNEAFRNFFIGLWKGIKGFFIGLWEGIKEVFAAIWNSLAGKVKAAVDVFKSAFTSATDLFKSAWNDAASFFSGLWDGIVGTVEDAKQAFNSIVDFISGIFTGNWERAWQGVKDIFRGIVDSLVALFKTPINAIIDLINGVIDGLNDIKIPDWVPGMGGKGINITPIPKLAKGADFSPDTFIAGEKGPELIMGAKGKKVFTALETSGIFGAISDALDRVANAANVVRERLETWRPRQRTEGIEADVTVNAPSDSGIVEAVKGIGGMIDGAVKFVADKIPQVRENTDNSGITDAIRSFSSDISVLAKSATASPATAQSMVMSTMNRNVTQTNYFESTFNGERAAQKRMSESAGKNAEDAAGILARALAYAR